jgi:hypothetical protein
MLEQEVIAEPLCAPNMVWCILVPGFDGAPVRIIILINTCIAKFTLAWRSLQCSVAAAVVTAESAKIFTRTCIVAAVRWLQ